MKNKKPLKVSEEFYNFLIKLGGNRVKADTDDINLKLCNIPDLIVKYFKSNNDEYLALVKMENKK